jgi:hypothetical protein
MDDLNTGLKGALRAHALKHQLGNIESDILICCETTSINQKSGLFGATKDTSLSAAYLTPRWLVWVDTNDRNKPLVSSAQLKQINIHDYELSVLYKIKPDHGLHITGRYTDVTQTGIVFLGIGSDPGGRKFREILGQTLKKAAS